MKSIKFNIPEPCHQNWENMTPKNQGRHCDACQKIVVDFTVMSDHEIIDYFNQHVDERICGRSKKSQLKRELNFSIDNKRFYKTAMIATSISIIALPLFSQSENEKTVRLETSFKHTFSISGIIKEPNGDLAISANVIISKNGVLVLGVSTDFDGRYQLHFEGEKLSDFEMKVTYIGYEDRIVSLKDHASPIHKIDVYLGKEAIIDINNVVVSGVVRTFNESDFKIPTHKNEPIKLTGTIYEPDGEPAISANVVLSQNGEFIKGVATYFDGTYIFTDLNPGIYEMTTSYIGFSDVKTTGNIIDKDTNVDIVLEDGQIILSGVIVVRQPWWKRLWRNTKERFQKD